MTAAPRSLTKAMTAVVLAVALIMGAIFGWQRFIGTMIAKSISGQASVPQKVSTTVAAASAWQPHTRALGSVRAVRGADLASQIAGVVDKIYFESGRDVAAGTVLLTLRPYDDPAKLAQLKAAAELAAITLKRDQEQLAAEAVSQATVDADAANLKSTRAQVVAQEALIEEKTVRAPFSGTLGVRQVDEGQYLASGTTVVTLQALDPIYIDFFVPQQALSRLKLGQAVRASIDAYPGVPFTGKVTSINSKVDTSSRNIQVRASFGNADHRLIPGMYAEVEIDSGESASFITLPQSAIVYNPYGDTVYVVRRSGADPAHPQLTVQQRFVKLGDTRGDQVAVTEGLAAGEEVVTAGQIKLRNGTPILVNNQVLPSNDANPAPPNE